MAQIKLLKWHRLPVWTLFFIFFLVGTLPPALANETASRSNFETITKNGVLRVGVSLFTPWAFKGK
ncbi:MAG: hypothetical protein OEM27_08150, partial [Nitrospinota bacterium]|nr:hypothetical protein [Nitrospinota bacterium]